MGTSRIDLPGQNSQSVYLGMQTERQRDAAEFRAVGAKRAQEVRSDADRRATIINANQKAQQLRGDGERNRIFAKAYGRDADLFAFYRSMSAYEIGLGADHTRFLLWPEAGFFRFFRNSGRHPAGAAA